MLIIWGTRVEGAIYKAQALRAKRTRIRGSSTGEERYFLFTALQLGSGNQSPTQRLSRGFSPEKRGEGVRLTTHLPSSKSGDIIKNIWS
jgi:hypothetical protein